QVASTFRWNSAAFRRNSAMTAAMLLAAAGVYAQGNADTAAVGKVRAAYEKASGAQDAAAIAKLYAADGVEMPPNSPAAKGRAAIGAYHNGFAQQFMVHGITLTATDTQVHGDTAVDIGTYKQSLMAQKGGGMSDDKGKYVVLLKKDSSGVWAITHAIYNSDLPPPGAKK